ncbi:RING/U-box superfamily protein [Forsythia ovata]|uniref:RING/U-box superfamily protein n=1 Tax=Forsythia ovata TaxID=205694 RepID=A0ABD1XD51_9LAMI
MWQKQTHKSSFKESIKALESDIQDANKLVAALPRGLGGDCVQMKLSYSAMAPFVLFLVEWMDYSCLDTVMSCLGLLHIHVYRVYVDGMPIASAQERKATLWDFYAVIYPSLKQLEGNLMELMEDNFKRTQCSDVLSRESDEENRDASKDPETEDECGICMELDSKVSPISILPILPMQPKGNEL